MAELSKPASPVRTKAGIIRSIGNPDFGISGGHGALSGRDVGSTLKQF